jgi:large conductance mechanosensitive channel
MSFLKEFKAFAMRGNVMDLAIAVIIGAAFGKIIAALVDGVIMPLIGLLLGGIDVSGKTLTIQHTIVKWGAFLQSIIDFTIIAFCIFVAVNLLNRLQKKEEIVAPTPKDIELLTEIRDILKHNARLDL